MTVRLAHMEVTARVNGPGRRLTVWVQGCPHRCAGCFNPGLLPPEGGERVPPAEWARRALALEPWEGVTLSGGEPFAQAAGLAACLDELRARRCRPFTVIAFTGYTLEQLRGGSRGWARLLERVDLLVDGPFRASEPAGGALRGSANQRLVPLTPAGRELARLADRQGPSGFLVSIGPGGTVIVSGFPPAGAVERLRRALEAGRTG